MNPLKFETGIVILPLDHLFFPPTYHEPYEIHPIVLLCLYKEQLDRLAVSVRALLLR